ncbi:hypothetical protein CcrColossus_gp052 [Caulobacter phage CcrColossus]|uniref:Uncharacterized protein n=1 Tax=Caulobacter phage CcrColossus TaxID=1211640 RepID=K4K616_9CAUD|nr:hypothetical protein CcrColossus_gp052 [Caulobacter phage CcrColossus]AFU87922.1 hypothetical protein CcrColossus_gp052 [Caulobacter phage CcrColossus]
MTQRNMGSYIYEPMAIRPHLLDAVFARVQSGEPFSPLDLSNAYRAADTAEMREHIQRTFGDASNLHTYENGASLADVSRIMLALRQSGAICQDFSAGKGRVLWKLETEWHGDHGTISVPVYQTVSERLGQARKMLEAQPVGKKAPGQDFNALEAHVIAHAEQHGFLEPEDWRLSPETGNSEGYGSYFRSINECAPRVDAPKRSRSFIGRIVNSVKDYVTESMQVINFNLRGTADLPVTEIMKASPEDKLRWANRHAPGEDIPIENRKNYYRPNLRPSIILRIPVG